MPKLDFGKPLTEKERFSIIHYNNSDAILLDNFTGELIEVGLPIEGRSEELIVRRDAFNKSQMGHIIKENFVPNKRSIVALPFCRNESGNYFSLLATENGRLLKCFGPPKLSRCSSVNIIFGHPKEADEYSCYLETLYGTPHVAFVCLSNSATSCYTITDAGTYSSRIIRHTSNTSRWSYYHANGGSSTLLRRWGDIDLVSVYFRRGLISRTTAIEITMDGITFDDESIGSQLSTRVQFNSFKDDISCKILSLDNAVIISTNYVATEYYVGTTNNSGGYVPIILTSIDFSEIVGNVFTVVKDNSLYMGHISLGINGTLSVRAFSKILKLDNIVKKHRYTSLYSVFHCNDGSINKEINNVYINNKSRAILGIDKPFVKISLARAVGSQEIEVRIVGPNKDTLKKINIGTDLWDKVFLLKKHTRQDLEQNILFEVLKNASVKK